MALDDIVFSPDCATFNGTLPFTTSTTPYTGSSTTSTTTTPIPYTGTPTTSTTTPYVGPETTTTTTTAGPERTTTTGAQTTTTTDLGNLAERPSHISNGVLFGGFSMRHSGMSKWWYLPTIVHAKWSCCLRVRRSRRIRESSFSSIVSFLFPVVHLVSTANDVRTRRLGRRVVIVREPPFWVARLDSMWIASISSGCYSWWCLRCIGCYRVDHHWIRLRATENPCCKVCENFITYRWLILFVFQRHWCIHWITSAGVGCHFHHQSDLRRECKQRHITSRTMNFFSSFQQLIDVKLSLSFLLMKSTINFHWNLSNLARGETSVDESSLVPGEFLYSLRYWLTAIDCIYRGNHQKVFPLTEQDVLDKLSVSRCSLAVRIRHSKRRGPGSNPGTDDFCTFEIIHQSCSSEKFPHYSRALSLSCISTGRKERKMTSESLICS